MFLFDWTTAIYSTILIGSDTMMICNQISDYFRWRIWFKATFIQFVTIYSYSRSLLYTETRPFWPSGTSNGIVKRCVTNRISTLLLGTLTNARSIWLFRTLHSEYHSVQSTYFLFLAPFLLLNKITPELIVSDNRKTWRNLILCSLLIFCHNIL